MERNQLYNFEYKPTKHIINIMKKALIGLLVAGAAIAANAQDKALLETLVKKGMLTQQEAAQIAKESVTVSPSTASTKSIKIFGGAQGWYTWAQDTVKAGNNPNPSQTSGFTLRYVKLGIEADVGGGWSAEVVTDFGTEGASRNYLDKVVASKRIDVDYINGTLQLGLRKANMGYEQTMNDFGQLAIERSIATNFFTRGVITDNGEWTKNFGSRTVGVFWDGEISQVEGMYYSVAVTSGLSEATNDFLSSAQNSSSLSFYAAMGYKNVAEMNGETIAYDFGLNFGYAPQGMTGAVTTQKGSVWGINPYATVSWRGLTTIAEFFLQQAEDYNPGANGVGRTPMGGNLTVAYKMDIGEWGAIEPVARASYISANGMPVRSEFAPDLYYNQALTGYLGVNWYATSSVKTSLGYEFGYFDQTAGYKNESGVARMYSNSVRAQVQVLF